MTILLQRIAEQVGSTIGLLILRGVAFHTLEDESRDPGVKVPHQTCIPPGFYPLTLSMSNRFKKVLPEVLNVPMFTGIRIHSGNTTEDTEGCILVGMRRSGKDKIAESRDAMAALMTLLQATPPGEPMYLEVRSVEEMNLRKGPSTPGKASGGVSV